MVKILDSDLKLKFIIISSILILLLNFGNFSNLNHDSLISTAGSNSSSNEGAYPVIWCDYLRKGDNLTYQIDSVIPNESVIFQSGGILVGTIGEIDDQVDNGYHGNTDSDFQYNGGNVSKNLIPPILVPKKVYRACCNAFKPLTVQLEDWGWDNFTMLEEGIDFLKLKYENDFLNANITYNTDGVALDFNASLVDFTYSAKLTSILPNDSSSTSNQTTRWDLSIILISFTCFLINRRRIKSNE